MWRHVRLKKNFVNREVVPHVGTKLRIPEVLLVEKLRTQQRFNVSAVPDLAHRALYQPPRAAQIAFNEGLQLAKAGLVSGLQYTQVPPHGAADVRVACITSRFTLAKSNTMSNERALGRPRSSCSVIHTRVSTRLRAPACRRCTSSVPTPGVCPPFDVLSPFRLRRYCNLETALCVATESLILDAIQRHFHESFRAVVVRHFRLGN